MEQATTAEPSPSFSVMVVCTGNICRSPVVEQVLRERYGRFGVEVSSAGTGALVGEGMPEQAQRMSEHLGGSPAGHRGRQVTKPLIEQADLVIGLARDHRRDLARLLPRSARYTFTLRELARLLESVVEDDRVTLPAGPGGLQDVLRGFVPVVAGHRGFAAQPEEPREDDVVDPFRRSQETYDRAEREMDDALTRIVAAIDALAARFAPPGADRP